jgi:hypothetical protein
MVEHEPGVARRSTSSSWAGVDERELQPGSSGGGRGGWGCQQREGICAGAGGELLYLWSRGSSLQPQEKGTKGMIWVPS